MLKVGNKNVPSIAIGTNVYDMRLLGQKVRVDGATVGGFGASVYERYDDSSPMIYLTEDVTGEVESVILNKGGYQDMWLVSFNRSMSGVSEGWIFPSNMTLLGGVKYPTIYLFIKFLSLLATRKKVARWL